MKFQLLTIYIRLIHQLGSLLSEVKICTENQETLTFPNLLTERAICSTMPFDLGREGNYAFKPVFLAWRSFECALVLVCRFLLAFDSYVDFAVRGDYLRGDPAAVCHQPAALRRRFCVCTPRREGGCAAKTRVTRIVSRM